MVQRANKDAARLGSGFLTSYAHAVRGLLLAYGGDAQASAVMASCLDALAGSPRLAFICRFVLGNRAVDAGALDAAEEHVRVAASLPVVRDLQPAGLALASRIALARGHVDEAARHAHAAVETQRACPDLELTAGVAELALAEALDARGETDAARGVLAEVHGALARIAGTIASAEGREHFWARRLPNDAVRARARAWGLE
jgi:hypothetical protein